MAAKPTRRNIKKGLPPGVPMFTGVQKMHTQRVEFLWFTTTEMVCKEKATLQEVMEYAKKEGVLWINIEGLHEVEFIQELSHFLGLHKLTQEDLLSTDQRPKVEEFPTYTHLVCRMLEWQPNDKNIKQEQLSLILQQQVVVTYQEKSGDIFTAIRNRIQENTGVVRQKKAEYLFYLLLDSVVDEYFTITEEFGEQLETIEDELIAKPNQNTLAKLNHLRKESMMIRKAVYPMREVVNKMEKMQAEGKFGDLKWYLRDLYDHIIQVMDSLEMYRELSSGLLDLYMNSLSNKTNDIMKVLTMMSVIFIPLTFIVGVYGMNFQHMPELEMPYGYFIVLGVMFLIFLVMLIYFKRKKWV